MDSRIELIAGTALRFNDGYEYRISNELARGGSSIVYNAFYIDNLGEKKTVRVKECYPFKCNLQRRPDGALVVPASEQRLFAEAEQKMRRAYQLGNELSSTQGLTNLPAHPYQIVEANNTISVVTA